MGTINRSNKLSKKAKLLLMTLVGSVMVVFSLLAVLLYINYYARVNVVLTTIARYKDGDIKSVSEYDIVRIKKGRNISYLPSPYVEGYSFEGWFLDEDCVTAFDYTAGLEENMQVYGKLDLIEYNIELVLDDDITVKKNVSQNFDYNTKFTIEDMVRLPYEQDTILLDDDSEISIMEYKLINKVGYTFQGWGFSSINYSVVNTNYKMTANNLTFYAVWKPIEIELQYYTMDLSFAETDVQSNVINTRLDFNTDGISYTDSQQVVYVSETLNYGIKITEIASPVDEYNNFEFAGWYMDPKFTVPIKYSQLYIRNGYFTLTKEGNTNILYDPLYFEGGQMPTAQQVDYINQYSNKNERNSFIMLFAKWTPKLYTIEYNLNLPNEDSYVSTANMTSIINPIVSDKVYSDDGDTIKIKTNIYQGCYLKPFDTWASVLYDIGYFRNAVYETEDLSGLPMYTIYGWNSEASGGGYDAENSSDVFFDKSNFKVVGNVITVYAQWRRYNRINYFYTNGSANTKVLLDTINVESSTVLMNTFENLVISVNPTSRVIEFTEKQKTMNSITSKTYQIPNNSTFIGWTNNYRYTAESNELYMPNYEYYVGESVHTDQGIYINEYTCNLYTAWITNTNYYTYDLGESIDDVNFVIPDGASESVIKSEILDANNKYIVNKFTGYITHYTLATISSNKFLITVDKGDRTHSLMGWTLKDGTLISGQSQTLIDFSSSSGASFVNNTELYKGQYHDINTLVYLSGRVEVNNDLYYTEYVEKENRSYIHIKAQSVRLLTMTGQWVENSLLTFEKGVDDATWTVGYSESYLDTKIGGSTLVSLPSVDGILSRPYYTFAGWSTVNREAGTEINYNTFISENAIFEAGKEYNIFDYEEFRSDTTFYAVWRPIIYSVSVLSKDYTSGSNSTITKVNIAKEKVTYEKLSATDNISIAGNSLVYYDVNDERQVVTLNASANTGYGLTGWTDSEGTELNKVDTYYTISVLDDINSLFVSNPSSTGDYLVSIYPMFGILKFDVTVKLSGDGLNVDETHLIEDVEYGTLMNDVLTNNNIASLSSYYIEGYEFEGWTIHGDVDNKGILLDDYVVDLAVSTKKVRSDLLITLTASKIEYSIVVVYKNPQGVAQLSTIYTLEHGDELSKLNDEVYTQLAEYDYVGYNFDSWDLVAKGITTSGVETLDGIIVTSRYDLSTNYTTADVELNFIYYSDNSTNTDKIETIKLEQKYNDVYQINVSGFYVTPVRAGYILKGWAVDVSGSDYYEDLESFILNSDVFNFKAYEEVDENGIKSYTINLQAKWVEARTLTFDTTGATLTTTIPLEMEYEINKVVYFRNLTVSTLTYNQITQNNYLGRYKGVWVDQDGKEYSVNVANTTITMDKNYVLTPKFEPVTYTLIFKYYYNGAYTTLASAQMQFTDDYDYTNVPLLHSELVINEYINAVTILKNYQALSYYLTQDAYKNKNDSLKISLGAEFDFANNLSYLLTRQNDAFTFIIDIEKVSTIFYYSDNSLSSSTLASVRVFNNYQYTIGVSDKASGVVDIIPEKEGYDFTGWATSVNGTKVYDNGQVITYTDDLFTTLLPVWEAKDVTINYYSRTEDGTPEEKTVVVKYSASITFANEPRNDYRTLGWAETGTGDVKYSIGQTISVSELYINYTDYTINLYAKYERLYKIYYSDGYGNTTSTELQSLIAGEEITLLSYSDTGLSVVDGGVFEGWTFDGRTITTLSIERRDGNTIYYNNGNSYIMGGLDDYSLTLTATWDIATYSIAFKVYDGSATETTKYGVIASGSTSIGDSANYYEHDRNTTYTFTFPTTTSTYSKDGQEYQFMNKWTDGVNEYTTEDVNITLIQNYVFTPVYTEIYTFTFRDVNGADKWTYTNLKDTTFNFSDLQDSLDEYNNDTLASSNIKVVGFENNGSYYSTTTSNDELSILTATFSTSVAYTSDKIFTAVVINYIDLVVYKDYDYDTTTFGTVTTINDFIVKDTIDLADYSYANQGYNTLGFVITTDASYGYLVNPTGLYSGEVQITESLTGSLSGAKVTLYCYPVLQAKVTLTINSSEMVKTDYVNIGSTYNLDYNFTNNDYYLSEWRNATTGVEYNASDIVKAPITFNANSLPYWSVQVSSNVSHIIDNYSALKQSQLRPTTSVTLPSHTDVDINDQYKNDYILQGWYVSYASSYVMLSGSRKVFATGATITIDEILTDIFETSNYDSSVTDGYSLTITPMWGYTIYSLTIDNSNSLASYDYEVTDISSLDYSTSDFSGSTFYVLSGGQVTFTTIQLTNTKVKSMSFTAYLYQSGNVVLDSNTYSPITATITITPEIQEGYVSESWCNTANPTEALSNFNITGNMTLSTLAPVADAVSTTVVLKYNNGSSDITLTSSNYSQYSKYCYLSTGSGDGYEKVFTGNYGDSISFSVVLGDGCEIKSAPGGQMISGEYVYTGTLSYESEIVIIVGKKSTFNPVVEVVDTSGISDFDSSLITSGNIQVIEYYNSTYNTIGTVSISSALANTTTLTNTINNGAGLRITTTLNSSYYYVDAIKITIDGVTDTYNTNDMSAGNRLHNITGTPHITIVLAKRTYSITYYASVGNANYETVVNSAYVTNTIQVDIPSFANYAGHTLQGMRVYSGTDVSTAISSGFVGYYTTDQTFNIVDIITITSGISRNIKDTMIHIEPVWLTDTNTISFTTDSTKGYFIVKYNNTAYTTTDETFDVFYGSGVGYTYQISANNAVSENVVTIEVFDTQIVSTYGEVTKTTKTYTIQFVPIGIYDFANGYQKADGSYLSNGDTITSDMTLTTYTQDGEGTAVVSIIDDATTGYNNANLPVANICWTLNNEGSVAYDSNGVIQYSNNCNNIPFTSDKVAWAIDISCEEGFIISSYDIIVKVEEYNTSTQSFETIEYKLSDGVDILTAYGISHNGPPYQESAIVVIPNTLIYNIEIEVTVEREQYTATLQLASATSGSTLETLMTTQTPCVVLNNNTEISTYAYTFTARDLREIMSNTITINDNCFEIESVYYICDGTTYKLYNSADDLSNVLTSFDLVNGKLDIVFGEHYGDIDIYIELGLKSTYQVYFHRTTNPTDDSMYHIYGYTDYAYGQSITLNPAELYTPSNITIGASEYAFSGWVLYCGDYATDLANDAVDESKFLSLSSYSISWTFGENCPDLHLFATWDKQYKLIFVDEVNADNVFTETIYVNPNDEIIPFVEAYEGYKAFGNCQVYGAIIDGTYYCYPGLGGSTSGDGYFNGYYFEFNGNRYELLYYGTFADEDSDGIADDIIGFFRFTKNNETIWTYSGGKTNPYSFNLDELLADEGLDDEDTQTTIVFNTLWQRPLVKIDDGGYGHTILKYDNGIYKQYDNYNYYDFYAMVFVYDARLSADYITYYDESGQVIDTRYAIISKIDGQIVGAVIANTTIDYSQIFYVGYNYAWDEYASGGMDHTFTNGTDVAISYSRTGWLFTFDLTNYAYYTLYGGESSEIVFTNLSGSSIYCTQLVYSSSGGLYAYDDWEYLAHNASKTNFFASASVGVFIRMTKGATLKYKLDSSSTSYQMLFDGEYVTTHTETVTMSTSIRKDLVLKPNDSETYLKTYLKDDTENISTIMGDIAVSYYGVSLTEDDEVEFDSTLTTQTSVDGSIRIWGQPYNKYYISCDSDEYELISISGGGKLVKTDSECYIDCTSLRGATSRTIKLIFEKKKAETSFVINGVTYASAYFEGSIELTETTTLDDVTPNEQLIAFANVITLGYKEVYENYSTNSQYEEWLDALFGNRYYLTGLESGAKVSKVIRDFDTLTYYTEGDFVKMFYYPVNQNIATYYYDVEAWQDIWFEGWNYDVYYPILEGVTIDSIFVPLGSTGVTFGTDGVSDALILEFDINSDALASGGIAISEESGVDYEYFVLGDSETTIVNGTTCYTKLRLKVKNDSKLPTFTLVCDSHTYVSQETIDSLSNLSGKIFTLEEGVDDSIEVDISKQYTFEVEFKVKKVKVKINFVNESGATIKNQEYDSTKLFDYTNTYNDIIDSYGVGNVQVGNTSYSLVKVETQNTSDAGLTERFSVETLEEYLLTYVSSYNAESLIITLQFTYKVTS